MNFAEQPPSKHWAALKFKGEKFAEVWFKPDGEPWTVRFRIPQNSFHLPDIGKRLTLENLLKAVAIAPEELASWRHAGLDGADLQLSDPFPPPAPDVPHLDILLRLKPPLQAAAPKENSEREIASANWQALEARWKTIQGLEATLETLRISMEGVRAELEASGRRTLTTEERLHALAADMTQWNKAKSRIHYALPKAKEFIHRATWAKGTPERKRLDELFKNPPEAPLPGPQREQMLEDLEIVRKDRQVLSAQGVAVHQECKGIVAEVQGALRRLQSNAAARAVKKKGATGLKGKSF